MSNKTIRDFIYMDKDRLYSLYSQVFEGVIEAVVESYSSELNNSSETSKTSKGQSIETQVAEASTKTENRILYDHMYNSLENKLSDVIFDVNKQSSIALSDLADKSLVKIRGMANLQDYNRLEKYVDKFNEIGNAIAYSMYSSLPKTSQKTTNATNIAKQNGLYLDPKLISNIKLMTGFFNKDGYDILISAQNSSNILYRGIINKEHLRVDSNILRTLYGDEPPMEWTMVGQITYIPCLGDDFNTDTSESVEASISDSYQKMFKSYRNVEKVFFEGKTKLRVHIAPLAIYTEYSHK